MWKFVFLYRARGRMLNFSPNHGGVQLCGMFLSDCRIIHSPALRS